MSGAAERIRAIAATYPRATIGYVMLLSCTLVYLPFLRNLDIVAQFWDGPCYVVVAKTFYALTEQEAHSFFTLPAKYYACHFPGYPLLIRICTFLTLGDYTTGMLLATVVSAIVAAVLFYQLLEEFRVVSQPLWSAVLFCILPPRWLIYHSAGASEPLFLCFVFACFLAYGREKPWLVVLFIMLASLTRITGVLLGPAFVLIYLMEDKWKQVFMIPVSGVGILLLFWIYHLQFGDFFAYFAHNIDNERIVRWPPLTLLASRLREGSNFHETEYLLMIYGIYGVGTVLLWKQKPLFIFSLVYFCFMLFVNHTDISRYFLAIGPFALLVGYDRMFRRKAVKLVVLLMVPFFYLYAWGYIPKNGMDADNYHNVLMFEKE